MDLNEFNKLVGSLAKQVESNETVATPILANKLAKSLEQYPHDQTLGAMQRVIEKMVDNNKLFLKKAELRTLYNQLHTRNNKFAQLFASELGQVDELLMPKVLDRNSEEELNLDSFMSDPVLANALNSVFDKTIPVKMYSNAAGNSAVKAVSSLLDSINFKPNTTSVASGNENLIVVLASYETPKGQTHFFVPVEFQKSKMIDPDMFMGNSGPQNINHKNVKNYISSFAGQKLKVAAEALVNIIVNASNDNRKISDTEMALARVKTAKMAQNSMFSNQITGQKVAEASVQDVKLPALNEFESFEKKFASPQGVALFTFGSETVNTGRDCIAREVSSFGYKSSQITVTGSDKNTIYYAVSLDGGKVAFTVPLKLAGKKLTSPTVLLCNGSLHSFNKETIDGMSVKNETDFKVAAAASSLFEMASSDLLDIVRTAAIEGNHAKAEDALNVLMQKGDKVHAIGLRIYMDHLQTKTASDNSPKCNLVYNNKSSKHPICGHTNLPLHKVAQDEHGNCIPLYRKDMDSNYEGGFFMTSKILG